MKTFVFTSLFSFVVAGSTFAQSITVDGTLDAGYGGPIVIQNTPTQFGDSQTGSVDTANGSELDAGYGRLTDDTLFLFFAGNLESNFNKLEVFIDSVPGGQNQLGGTNPDVDFNGLNRMGDDGGANGLTFDVGFGADHYLTFTGGNVPYQLFGNYAAVATGGAGGFIGGGDGTSHSGDFGISFAINNSNIGGVTGSSVGTPGEVSTGFEVAVPLSLLGNPTGAVKVTAFINGGGHDFLSNQVLGGVGDAGNLGEPRNVDFSAVAGDQFYTVAIPEPSVTVLLGLGALLFLGLRLWHR